VSAVAAFSLLGAAIGLGIAPTAWAGGATHEVRISQLKFVPESLEIAEGDTVLWKNEDIFPHTATAEGTGKRKAFDSGNLAAGKSWSFTFRKKGRTPYLCTFHPTMKGAITVK
jgi:plastocyanin